MWLFTLLKSKKREKAIALSPIEFLWSISPALNNPMLARIVGNMGESLRKPQPLFLLPQRDFYCSLFTFYSLNKSSLATLLRVLTSVRTSTTSKANGIAAAGP